MLRILTSNLSSSPGCTLSVSSFNFTSSRGSRRISTATVAGILCVTFPAIITISQINGIDTLYLTNVQGSIPTGPLVYYDTDSTTVSLASTNVTSSTPDSGLNSGNYFKEIK